MKRAQFVEDAFRWLQGDSGVENPSAMAVIVIGPDMGPMGLSVGILAWGDRGDLVAVLSRGRAVAAGLAAGGSEGEFIVGGEDRS